jgi:predicted amidohydrolase YtcJ
MTTLYANARIHGGTRANSATAMTVEAGRIAWLGRQYAGQVATTVDLGGAFVAPAFVDAHVHATSAGLLRTGLDLTGVGSLSDLLDAVRDRVRANTDVLLWGHGWDETRWPENRPPTSAELDAVAGGTPVYLSRVDVHSALASSALVDLAPAARTAPGWSDGPLSRDAHHHVRRAARDSITADQRREAQLEFLRHAAAMGIACVHECGGPEIAGADDFAELLSRSGDLPQVVGYWGAFGELPAGARGLAGDLFVDGAFGSRTAALRAPYTDRPDTSGARYLTGEQIADHLVACSTEGRQAGFHVIGDAGADAVVEGFDLAEKRVGLDLLTSVRHRLEHLEMIDIDHAYRLGSLGVVASVQPLFDAYWGGRDGMYAQRLGERRANGLNRFAHLHEAGVTLAFGSDAPVTSVDPWATVRAAVRHKTQIFSVPADVAFAAHTTGGWRAAGDTSPLAGRLAIGAPATYAVWDAPELVDGLPPLDQPPRCLRTVHNGTTIHEVP